MLKIKVWCFLDSCFLYAGHYFGRDGSWEAMGGYDGATTPTYIDRIVIEKCSKISGFTFPLPQV